MTEELNKRFIVHLDTVYYGQDSIHVQEVWVIYPDTVYTPHLNQTDQLFDTLGEAQIAAVEAAAIHNPIRVRYLSPEKISPPFEKPFWDSLPISL